MTEQKESKRLSIADIKRTNAAAGQHWFEPGALRFFNSKVLPTVYQGPGGVYFVTSERYDDRQPLRFSVRKAIDGGKRIDTVGEFQAHADAASAVRVAKLRAAGATDVYERTAGPAKAKSKATAVRAKKASKPKADTKTRRKPTKKRTPPTTTTPVAAPPKESPVASRPAAATPSPAAPANGGPQRRAAVALSEMVSALTRAEHVNTCEEAWDALSEARRHRMAARRHLLSVPTSQASGSAELVRTLVMADERAADLVRKLGWCQATGMVAS